MLHVKECNVYKRPVLLWKPRERTGRHVWAGCASLERGRVWAEVDNSKHMKW